MLQTLMKFMPIATRIIDRKTTLPILSHICVSGGQIKATDLETYVSMTVEDSRSYTLPLNILKEVMRSRPKLLEIDLVDDNKVRITYDSKSITFPSMDVEEFPSCPGGRFKATGVWTKDVLLKLYKQLPYLSTDEMKLSLTGVYVNQNKVLSSCATDGHVLRFIKNADPEGKAKLKSNFQGVLPRKSVMILSKVVHGNVRVAHRKGHLRFTLGKELEIFVKLIDEKYPDFENVIPSEHKGEVCFDKNTLKNLVAEAKPFAVREMKVAAFMVNKDDMTLKVEDMENDIQWESSVPVIERKGESIKIGLNLVLLERILRGIDEKEVMWHYSTPVSASIFSGANGSADTINLIMPIRLEKEEQ